MAILALAAGEAAPLYAQETAIDLRADAGTAVTVSSIYIDADGSNDAWKASDWSGMTGTFPDGAASTDWYTSWASEGYDDLNYTNEWIAWDLGRTYTVSRVHVWNFNESAYADEGIKKLDIQKWTGAAWKNVYTGLEWSQATDSSDYAGFDQVFSTPITTSKIRFAHLENFGSVYGVGISEVVFYAVPSPPHILGIAADPISGNVVVRWEGGREGMQFQVEKATDLMWPFQPLGDPQASREHTDVGALRTNSAAFYRVHGN